MNRPKRPVLADHVHMIDTATTEEWGTMLNAMLGICWPSQKAQHS